MDSRQDVIVVAAPNQAGRSFIRKLEERGLPFAAIAGSERERRMLAERGVERILLLDAGDDAGWSVPPFPIGNVYLFERCLSMSCRYIRICRKWTSKPIYVITNSGNPTMVYKGFGASYVIRSNGDDTTFLID